MMHVLDTHNNAEYPVKNEGKISAIINPWGLFKNTQVQPWSDLAEFRTHSRLVTCKNED